MAGRPGLVLAIAALASCSSPSIEAERAIRSYDAEVVHAYRTFDYSRLREVAAEAEATRLVVLADLKRASGRVLESDLEKLELLSARPEGGDRLVAEARERWRYFDRPTGVGETAGPAIVAEMTMRYTLQRQQGRWKVVEVDTVANEYLEPRGYAPPAQGLPPQEHRGLPAPEGAGGVGDQPTVPRADPRAR